MREEAAGRAFGLPLAGTLLGALAFGQLRFRLPAAPAQAIESDAVPFVFLEEEHQAMSRDDNKKREGWNFHGLGPGVGHMA